MERTLKARLIADAGLCKILQMKDNKPTVIGVPGSEGRSYQVIIRRFPGKISLECNLDMDKMGIVPCEGNKKTVCYHALAALYASAKLAGQTVSICHNETDAKRLANMSHGMVALVESWNGGKPMYMMVKGSNQFTGFPGREELLRDLDRHSDLDGRYGQ